MHRRADPSTEPVRVHVDARRTMRAAARRRRSRSYLRSSVAIPERWHGVPFGVKDRRVTAPACRRRHELARWNTRASRPPCRLGAHRASARPGRHTRWAADRRMSSRVDLDQVSPHPTATSRSRRPCLRRMEYRERSPAGPQRPGQRTVRSRSGRYACRSRPGQEARVAACHPRDGRSGLLRLSVEAQAQRTVRGYRSAPTESTTALPLITAPSATRAQLRALPTTRLAGGPRRFL